ncbi:MAG: hypothetical protein NW216_00995 [Hyphomicrobium sp.]|nr:hypothetical protein [Hyphomicrobium sp.]
MNEHEAASGLLTNPAVAEGFGWALFALTAFMALKAVARSGVNGNLKPLALPAALGFIGLSGGFAWIGAFWGG